MTARWTRWTRLVGSQVGHVRGKAHGVAHGDNSREQFYGYPLVSGFIPLYGFTFDTSHLCQFEDPVVANEIIGI